MSGQAERAALLGDTVSRDYVRKLDLFNRFARRELQQALASLGVRPGMRVLDAGCGAGAATQWLAEAVEPGGVVVGIDLAAAHAGSARRKLSARHLIVQGTMTALPLPDAGFDLIWCCNALNHVREPLTAVREFRRLLKPGGQLALGQSSLQLDMLFAWDQRLERVVHDAVRRYYEDRYGLDERAIAGVRSLLGWARGANLQHVRARTLVIERTSPVDPDTRDYLLEAIFAGTLGKRLRPYLSAEDYGELSRLTDANHPDCALLREDFHFLQTLTIVTGMAADADSVRDDRGNMR